MELEDEGRSGEESESESEYEEYTDSEDEMEPRLKPVFIRKWVTQLRGSALGRIQEAAATQTLLLWSPLPRCGAGVHLLRRE